MVERIGAAYRSIAGAVRLPGAKKPTGKDVSYGLGIGEVCVKMQRRAWTDCRHLQTLDVKLDRQLSRPQGIDDQLCFVKEEPIDGDLYLSILRAHVTHLATLFPGWQIQLQSFYIYGIDMMGNAKKLQYPHAKLEFRHTDDRLKSWFVIIGIRRSKNSEPVARDLKSLEQ